MKKLAISILGASIIFYSLGQASENKSEDKPSVTMDEVIVTATRQAEKISSIPANITVITEDEISRSSSTTIPNLLRSTAGILVNDIAGNGRSYTVDLSGFGETALLNTLVLVDGRRINQSDLSGTDWTLIPKDRVQRIEIVRGSRGSVLYGDNAAGGVINIITKKGEENSKFSGKLESGSYDTFLSSTALSGTEKQISYALNANFRTTEGYRDNSDTNAKDIGLNFDFFASDKLSINVSGGYHEDKTGLPGSIKQSDLDSGVQRTASLQPDNFSETIDNYVQISPELYFTDSSYIKIDTSSRKRRADSFLSFGAGSSLFESVIDTIAISPQIVLNEKLFGYTSKFTVGCDYNDSKWKVFNEAVFFGFPSTLSAQMTRKNTGYFAHEEFSITEKFALSGGVRYDRIKFKFPTGASPELSIIDEEIFTAGATYRIVDDISAYFSYTKNFRHPLLDELFDIFTNTFNARLTSQTGDNYETGLLVQIKPDISLGLKLSEIDTDNEIFYNTLTFTNMNLDGETIRKSIQISASKKFKILKLNSSYTFRETEIKGGTYSGKEIPNVPAHQITFNAQLQFMQNFLVNLNGSYVGERPFISDFANTHDDQEDYFYLSGKLSYNFEKGSFFVTINNILNEKYSEFGGLDFADEEGFHPSPEINLLIGLNWEF